MKNLALKDPSSELVDMESYQREERIIACGGIDPIHVLVAYAQFTTHDPHSHHILNNFGTPYREGTKLYLHEMLAAIVVDAAIELYHQKVWKTQLLDGLRTVDSQKAIREIIGEDSVWYRKGLLSTPGTGAHPKGFAIDLRQLDKDNREIDMGTPFDEVEQHEKAHRNFQGLDAAVMENRRVREQALLKAAFKHGQLLYPLPSEHWHFQLPENLGDLWCTLASISRVLGEPPALRAEFKKLHFSDYAGWTDILQKRFTPNQLEQVFGDGAVFPPPEEGLVYHGEYKHLRDEDLPLVMRQSAIT